MTLQHRSRRHWQTALILSGRYLAGRPLDGKRRTNSTWLRHADTDLTEHQRSARWHWRPGWHRSSMRIIGLAAASGAAYAWFNARGALLIGACIAAGAGLLAAGLRIWHVSRDWSHRRHVIYPLWHQLATMTGYPVDTAVYRSVPVTHAGHAGHHKRERPQDFLHIPRDYASNDKAVVRWEPPYTWEGTLAQQKAVTGVIERKLGQDWVADWIMSASPRVLIMKHAPQPPEIVLFDDFARLMADAPENILRLGYGAKVSSDGERPQYSLAEIDLDSDAPHLLISMSTGGGKSDTTAGIIAALVRKSVTVDIIDPKRISHSWAAGLPGVKIHKYVTAQMQAISDARILMDSRYDALDVDETARFPRHVIVIEESNSFMQDLRDYWTDYLASLEPAERRNHPKQNPAIRDLRYLLSKSRQARINIISVFQRASADAAAGGDARENYGARLLARYSPQTWRLLVGTPYIRPPRIPGRAMLVIGDESHIVQRVYAGISDRSGQPDAAGIARLRAWALNGRPDSRDAGKPVTAPVLSQAREVINDSEPVTLREACESGVIGMRYSAARKARQRDEGFPAGLPGRTGQVYEPAALRAWYAGRSDREPAPAAG
jgi:hypothetical protein